MAARSHVLVHAEKTKKLIGATQLLNRLMAHGNGEIEMTSTQIQAAKIVIGKYIPDLKAIEITGNPDKPLAIETVRREIV